MKLLPTIAATILLIAPVAEARLNESHLQLTQRFGQAQLEKPNQAFGSRSYTFKHDGWSIQAFLLNGNCHAITYSKMPLSRLTDAQVLALLKSNSEGRTWKRKAQEASPASLLASLVAGPYMAKDFVRSDGKALCTKASHSMTFKTGHWVNLEHGRQVEKQAAREAVPRF